MENYEKLGAFYLGRRHDQTKGATSRELFLYDSKDLTTHAVCVGMTGSGKTGLGVTLLEEAAIDGIPVIAIDPKGDLANLALTFPQLRAEDFRPWLDAGAAARAGQTPEEFAGTTAESWRRGLAEWDQPPERIQRLRDAAEVSVYTPGSTAGLPITVLRSFDAPAPALRDDSEAMRDRVQSAVSGLLALLGVEAEPMTSREHILLSNVLDRAWRAGRSLDLSGLIAAIQSPGFDKVGVFDLESFFPAPDRLALAMRLNNLLASPGFSAWLQGEPLDIAALLHTPAGKPRISIFSIAHLSEAERMFFVTILLNEMLAWTRSQGGTSSLRALLYMDEVFGYFPPVKEPPSKLPMLTLLKQARAYGVGVVLATQNPVDLDYKGLANAGTWFIGRLQTERDKQKVIEGLEGASVSAGKSFDRAAMEQTLAGLSNRVFLMNNVHEDAPALFHTRWALSYLRGPMTRNEIRALTEAGGRIGTAPSPSPSPSTPPAPGTTVSAPVVATTNAAVAAGGDGRMPVIPNNVPQVFLAATGVPAGSTQLYRPALLGRAKLHFVSAQAKADHWQEVTLLADLGGGAEIDWDAASTLSTPGPGLEQAGRPTARYQEPPAVALRGDSYEDWKKSLAGYLYQSRTVTVWSAPAVKELSRPDESERDFRVRLKDAVRERRDRDLEKLRASYAPKLARIEERIRAAEGKVERETAQYSQQKMHTAVSVGATLLGALFGRKVANAANIGRASTAIRGASRAAHEKEDIGRAEDDLAVQQSRLHELEAELETEIASLQDSMGSDEIELTEMPIRPRKSDTTIVTMALAWVPWAVDGSGVATACY